MERPKARILVCLVLAACLGSAIVCAQDPFTLVHQPNINTLAPGGDAPVLVAPGRPDLVAVMHPSLSAVGPMLATGSGGVSVLPSLALGAMPTAAIAADVDGDGQSELVVITAAGKRIMILERTEADTLLFIQQIQLPGVPTAIAAGDLDGDGSIDLAVTLIDLAGFAIAFNDGTGTLALEPTITGVITPAGIAIGDFDRDEVNDLAISSELTDRVSIWLGDGAGVFTSESQSLATGRRPRHLMATDLSRDARDDLVVTLNSAGSIERFDADENGALISQGRPFVGQQPTRVRVVDLDQDTRPDLVVSLAGEEGYTLLRNAEDGLVVQEVTTPERTFDVSLPDLDADGLPDFIATTSTALQAYPALNRTPSLGPRCPGDTNGDLFVDAEDFLMMLVAFGSPAEPPNDGADLDGDGFVGVSDFFSVLVAFGSVCGDN
ncbi:MAG: FG-GAP-like repeat-containing protein [Planctomycetota bacterium]